MSSHFIFLTQEQTRKNLCLSIILTGKDIKLKKKIASASAPHPFELILCFKVVMFLLRYVCMYV